MKRIIIFILLVIPVIIQGQDSSLVISPKPKRNTIYLELGGQGILYSVNYDRLFRLDKKVKHSFSCGLMTIPDYRTSDYNLLIGVPVSYNFIHGQKNNHLELGLGFTIMTETYSINYYDNQFPNTTTPNAFRARITDVGTYFNPKIGYRYQKPNGGFFFKLAVVPYVNILNRDGAVRKGTVVYEKSNYSTFSEFAEFSPFFPTWVGISFGCTF